MSELPVLQTDSARARSGDIAGGVRIGSRRSLSGSGRTAGARDEPDVDTSGHGRVLHPSPCRPGQLPEPDRTHLVLEVDSGHHRGLDRSLEERRRMEKETVLIVDDEEMVLTSLSAYLTLETTYDVVTFTSAAWALQHLEKNDVGIIISDFLMPEMDGIMFLAKAKELRPDAPRVLLTGYADKENAIKAINQVGLYQYVEKPWDNDDLRLIIRNGLEKKQLLAKLTQKVSQINQAYSELQSIQQEILKAFA
jgi:FixJ family two-component response regulator